MSSLRHAAVFLALGAAAGCGLATGPLVRDEPALIIFYGDTSAVEVADTVALGTTFDVAVRTFGGGCTREAARTVARHPASDVLEIHPVNRTRVASAANAVCTDDLLHIRHAVTVTAAVPGPLLIQVHGAQRGGVTGSTTGAAIVERTILVR